MEDVYCTVTFKDPLTKAVVATQCVSVKITQIKSSERNLKLGEKWKGSGGK